MKLLQFCSRVNKNVSEEEREPSYSDHVWQGTRRPRHHPATRSRPTALFIGGSINQTRQLHAVARQMPDWSAFFTPFYGDRAVALMRRLGLLESTIGGTKRRQWCLEYMKDHGLALDLDGQAGHYDLVVTCSDLVVPANIRSAPLVVVQEGLLDPIGPTARACRRLKWLPRWFAGTALTGQSGLYDRFCVASGGYRDFFVSQGVDAQKVAVTGIPNFDDCARYRDNDFPHRGHFLVCTSDARELFKREDRAGLVRQALRLARGRLVIFKLHPNENHPRAIAEIRALAPDALVYETGSAEEMIANADGVMTQWSSTLFVALALGKEVSAPFPLDELRRLQPVQNGGQSAANIARVCRDVLASSSASHDASHDGPATERSRHTPDAVTA
jgi:hypothetical protein